MSAEHIFRVDGFGASGVLLNAASGALWFMMSATLRVYAPNMNPNAATATQNSP